MILKAYIHVPVSLHCTQDVNDTVDTADLRKLLLPFPPFKKQYHVLTCIHEFCNLLPQIMILDYTQQSNNDRRKIHHQHAQDP